MVENKYKYKRKNNFLFHTIIILCCIIGVFLAVCIGFNNPKEIYVIEEYVSPININWLWFLVAIIFFPLIIAIVIIVFEKRMVGK